MRLDFEWLEAPGVKDEAEAATWAELQLEVAGVVVSELHDERHRVVRSRFTGSALVLAEWLVEAWPRLLHERRVPIEGTDEWWDWRGYHRFRTGRRGGAMPNVEFARFSDDEVEVTVVADQGPLAPGMAVRFLRSARARVPVDVVMAELERFVQAVAARLAPIRTARAASYCARLAARTVGSRAALAGRLGLAEDEAAQALGSLFESPQADTLAAIIEASVAPTFEQRLEEAKSALLRLPRAPAPVPRWGELEQTLRRLPPTETAWVTGWAAAERFREVVGLAETEALTPIILRDRCSWDAWACLSTTPQLVMGVDTVHVREPGAPPALVTTHQTRPAQTFRVARALYHGLFGGAARVVADSRLVGSRFSEANAFAAELLAPVERLKQLAPTNRVWEDQHLDAASTALGVSRLVVQHQVQNRGLGHVALGER